MNAKQAGVGIVVGTVAAMILGYVIFDLLAAGFYEANMGPAVGAVRDTQVIWSVVLGTAAYSALITWGLASRSADRNPVGGLKVGATVGFLLWFTADFIFFGIWNVTTLPIAIVDPLLEAIRGGLTGATIAVISSKL